MYTGLVRGVYTGLVMRGVYWASHEGCILGYTLGCTMVYTGLYPRVYSGGYTG